MGTANGKLYVLNSNKYCYSSESSTQFPVCKILPLPNTSSFFSACSPCMIENHPYYRTKGKNSQFKKYDPKKVPSIVVHWVIRTDAIEPRANSIRFNVRDFAISPTNPNFALILTDNGALYGYSIEDLKFTNLYINEFEGKPATSIFSESFLEFYVSHEKIDSIDIQTMCMNDYSTAKALTMDISDGCAAIIDYDGNACLIKGNRTLQKVTPIEGGLTVFSGIISKKNWVSIVHTQEGDKIFLKEKEKVSLGNDSCLVPGCIIRYGDFYHRNDPEFISFITESGKLVFIDGHQEDCFFTENIEFIKIFEDNDHFYIFCQEKIIDFDGLCFCGTMPNSFGIPLAMKNGKLLIIDSEANSVSTVDINTQEKQQLLSDEFSLINQYNSIISFCCKDNILMHIDLTKDEFVCEKSEDDFYPTEDIIMWRDYQDAKITITRKNKLKMKKSKIEICDPEEKILLFEPIDETGKVTKEGPFILIVTMENVYIFVNENNKFKRARKESFGGRILDASVAEWGSLLLRLENSVQLITLPDPSFSPIFCHKFSAEANACLVPHKGAFIFENGKTYAYLRNNATTSKPIYDPEVPQLKVPRVSTIQKLFGKKDANLKDADEAFQHKRAQREAAKLSETTELMQQILVTAQKRGEVLNEMEIKANRILQSAQRYQQICHELAKK
ncbi:hypothetical protein GPJ56_001637 [Histomonas meleagridis]|uniref:uncharacterized protein n=1 Tax=Histomonas meleagridis TaxID=135588 RepID=UPI00355A4B4C|nr:hypothetical protein GPJ56_001637 [Histomonas meleagridis]KAH0796277.1 hypothetical protein GO595_010170 [Histomonas meleagridis]